MASLGLESRNTGNLFENINKDDSDISDIDTTTTTDDDGEQDYREEAEKAEGKKDESGSENTEPEVSEEEESDIEEGDEIVDEVENKDDLSPETWDSIPVHLQENPFLKQLEQIMELREMHKRVNSKLSWTKGVDQDHQRQERLMKAESKVVTFLEDEIDKISEQSFQTRSSKPATNNSRPIPKGILHGGNTLTEKVWPLSDGGGQENPELVDLESDSEASGPNTPPIRNPEKFNDRKITRNPDIENMGVGNPISSGSFHVDEFEDPATPPSRANVVKKPFLRRRSGLLRFYKNEVDVGFPETSVSPNLTEDNDKGRIQRTVKRPSLKSIENRDIVVPPKAATHKPIAAAMSTSSSRRVKDKSQANVKAKTTKTQKENKPQPHVRAKNLNVAVARNKQVIKPKSAVNSKCDEIQLQQQNSHYRESELIEMFRHLGQNKSPPVVKLSLANAPKDTEVSKSNSSIRRDFDDLQELKIFEQLEALSARSSFGSSASLVQKFINKDNNLKEKAINDTMENRPNSRSSLNHLPIEIDNNTSDEDEDRDDKNKDFTAPNILANSIESHSRKNYKTNDIVEEELDLTSEDDEIPSISLSSLTADLEGMLKQYSYTETDEAPQTHSQDRYSNPYRTSGEDRYKTNQPEYSRDSSAFSMTRLHEQERRQKELKRESLLVQQMREKLETMELSLKEDKVEFEKYKRKERSKLDNYKAKLDQQSLSLQKISEETERVRQLNLDYQVKVQGMSEKIVNLEAERKRKSNRWESTNKKHQERIETLEKLNEKLESEKFSWASANHSHQPSANLGNNNKKKIHFADENKSNQRPKIRDSNNSNSSAKSKVHLLTKQSQVVASKASKSGSTGYFSETQLKKASDSERTVQDLRSAMKPTANGFSPDNNRPASEHNDTGSLESSGLPTVSTFGESSRWEDWIADGCNSSNSPARCNVEIDDGIFNLDSVPADSGKVNEYKSRTSTNSDGDVEKVYSNGTRKYVSKSRQFVRLIYTNGDIKETRSDGSVQYFYSELGIRQYTYPNGLEMTSYSNGQMERKNPDGTTEVLFTNGCVKFIRSDGKEEFIFPDNTVYQVNPNGEKSMFLPNGQKEIHTDSYKRRIYPDGTTRTIHSNGTFETIYPNGRIRLKDSSGNLLSDTIESNLS